MPIDINIDLMTTVSWNQAEDLLVNSQLKTGFYYKIINRPYWLTRPAAVDCGIIVQAISPNTFSPLAAIPITLLPVIFYSYITNLVRGFIIDIDLIFFAFRTLISSFM